MKELLLRAVLRHVVMIVPNESIYAQKQGQKTESMDDWKRGMHQIDEFDEKSKESFAYTALLPGNLSSFFY